MITSIRQNFTEQSEAKLYVKGINEQPKSDDKHIDLMRLTQLQRRISEEAKSKRKLHEASVSERRAESTINTHTHLDLDLDDSEEDDPMNIHVLEKESIKKGITRRQKYEELVELQNMSEIMLNEYLANHDKLTQRKVRTLTCKTFSRMVLIITLRMRDFA
jgi:hypothetical protein